MTLYDLDTPCVLVDRTRMERNIAHMQHRAQTHGLALRPHGKTHKSAEIARLQLRYGACGLTASRVAEALHFLAAGAPSVTIAYPLLSPAQVRSVLHTAAEYNAAVQFIADSTEGIAVLTAAATEQAVRCGVFLKIDTGLHRCGLPEGDAHLPVLARTLADSPVLRFAGLLSHAGHAYSAANREAVARIADEERSLLLRVRDTLVHAGIPVDAVSVGSTPTALAAQHFGGLTELRPGNYVFLDGTQVRLGVCTEPDVALSVLTTVVSRNATYAIVDAGSKTLSSDLGAHGTAAVATYGTAYTPDGGEPTPVLRLSEEHGFVRRQHNTPPVGGRMRILPNHACPVVNLAARLYIVEGEHVVDVWEPGARNAH